MDWGESLTNIPDPPFAEAIKGPCVIIPETVLLQSKTRAAAPSLAVVLLVMAIPAIVSGVMVTRLLARAHTDMNVPVVYNRDALYELTIFKAIGEGNLPWRNVHLAAPFGSSDWRDYPLYQWIDYAAFRVASLFTNNYLRLLNWYWVFTIMVTAGVAAFAFLRLRVSPMAAGCLGFLYGIQPYVFTRNISHFNLLCYLVPLLAAACLEIAAGGWERPGEDRGLRDIPLYAWLGFLLQGISFFYFSFFAVLLVSAAAFYGACARRTWRPVMHAAVLVTVMVGATVVGMSPTLVHWMQHGTNPAAVTRSAAEAEVHGLRIRHLLTPVPEHPLAVMRRLSQIAEEVHQDRTEATTTRLGLLGGVGFVALMVYLFAALAGWRLAADDGLITACSVLLLAALLWCTVGGFGSIFNTYITPVIRAYDRIIVFIVFFILAAYGVVVSAVVERKRWNPIAVAAALVLITGASYADVLWIPSGIQTSESRQDAKSDRQMVGSIEQALGGKGMVFQIPYTDYPNSGGPGKILPFDHARPYLQSAADVRWSWGAVVNTDEARWMQEVAALPPDQMVARLREKGFNGIWIDSFGYADAPATNPAKAIGEALGSAAVTSSDGRFLFFALSGGGGGAAVAAPAAAVTGAGGVCAIDKVDDVQLQRWPAVAQRGVPLEMEGWVANVETGVVLPEVSVEITGGGKRLTLRGSRLARPDVASHFGKASLGQAGFSVKGDVKALPAGRYEVKIVQSGPGSTEGCSKELTLELR
jgi:phosphoglycerol transferase